MPAQTPQINITFRQSTFAILTSLATHEHKSVANLAKELILEALECRENMILASIAKIRNQGQVETRKHSDVWE